jgi:hypothetical protein
MVVRRASATALATSLALVALTAVAHAGAYHVYSCRTPDGQAAPVDGWSGSIAPGSAADDYALDTCAEGGALIADLEDATTHLAEVDRSSWVFTTPSFDHLAEATFWRADDNAGGSGVNSTYQTWITAAGLTNTFEECVYAQGCSGQGDMSAPLSLVNEVTAPTASLGSTVYVNAGCRGGQGRECPALKGDANGYAAAVYLYAADLTLEQGEGPHADNVSGELATAPSVAGTSDVAFDATDPGSGVYEALFSVDGQIVQRTVLDENGGRCRDVGQTSDGLPAFLYLQPCLSSLSADVGFDTTSFANGAHHLLVSVIDAAGNAAPVLDRTVTVENPPPPTAPGAPGAPNGANASTRASMSVRWNGTRKPLLLSGFGRAQSATGRLTAPGGAPIVGASVEVSATPAYAGARTVAIGSVRTDASGSFALRLPGDVSSRTLRFAYRAHLGDALPVVTRSLRLSVHAGIVLSVSPHTTSVGRTIVFRGRLRGGPVPSSGKQLVLEARSPGSPWIEFDVVRTDRRGRYHASYRFKFPGPADYTFRARSEPESDYPYAAGASNVVAVHER